jgi:acyl-[acyl-carrier-protein]-phospholipid O-acyltransferase/long-chain-fatty-acid--[acyl-carrier-protein] ligase
MMAALIRELTRGLLRLRYRIRVTGLDEVAARGTRGILFLPNHPALIDPVIVLSELHRRFQPRPLADKDQINLPVVRTLAKLVRAFPMPDPVVYGQGSHAEVDRAIADCIASLKRGENILMYPAGHILRRCTSDLAGNSAVETILREAPEVRVVLLRTTGLWGSAFSRASGRAPRLGALAVRLPGFLLANGVFFGPRRAVQIECAEPADIPRQADRTALNRALEDFYNREAPPHTYVPHTWWERGGRRVLPEPGGDRDVPHALADVPLATRELVMRHLQEVTGRHRIEPEDHLARDLGLDSLALVELAMWVEHEFGFVVGDGTGLERVVDLLLAARGEFAASAPVELKPVPAAWFAPGGPGGRVSLPEGDTLLEVLVERIRARPSRAVLADQALGIRTYRDVVTGILVFKPEIEALEGDHIGIMLPASPVAGILYFAVLAAGKIPVMVNWTVGVRNLTHSLDLLGVKHVLTAGALLQKLETQAAGLEALTDRFVLLEQVAQRIGWPRKLAAWVRSRAGWAAALRPARRHATAVVLFTSGSESLPKAVPLTHTNILANLRDLCRVFEFHHDDRLIGMLPPFHSFGLVVTTVLPLVGGVPVVYHANPTEGALLARLVEAYKVTLLVGTPTFLNGIVRGVRAGELDSLRRVISGAEKCPEPLYELVQRLWPHAHLVEGYGITECSPVVSLNDEQAPQPGTIGKVLPSVEYAVVAVEGAGRVPQGQKGLLLVRGPSIFDGYLNYEGASPFVAFEGKQWYRTGDLVSEAPDGVLTFAGRLKRFVKLGGEMISLPAIEDVLNRKYARASDDEPVLAVEATPVELNPELVLFTVRDLDREEVNRCIRVAGLSALHTIRLVVKVDAIPLLGTGKTDYRALKTRLLPDPPAA